MADYLIQATAVEIGAVLADFALHFHKVNIRCFEAKIGEDDKWAAGFPWWLPFGLSMISGCTTHKDYGDFRAMATSSVYLSKPTKTKAKST